MEINNINRSNKLDATKQKKIQTKKDFSQNFKDAKDKKSEQELKKMVEDIKKKGNKLVLTKCYADVRVYKRLVKSYLKEVLDNIYKVKNNTSFWQTQYFITVETIDKKLEELTEMVLVDEKENLAIAATIDEIQGMMIDIYR